MADAEEYALHTERWCAGLRCTGSRSFEPAERALLEEREREVTRRFWTQIACIPAGVIVPLAAGRLLPRTFGVAWIDAVVALAVIVVAFLIPALVFLRLRVTMRERRELRLDLGGGELLHFDGTLEAQDVLDEEQKRLLDLGLLAPKPGAPQRIEVLPASSAIVRPVSGRRLDFVPVTIAEVAAGPSYAMRVEVPRELAWLDGAPEVRFLRRTLSPHERAELVAHIHHLRRPGVVLALWTIWLTAWVVAAVLSPQGVVHYIETRWMLVIVQIVVLSTVVAAYVRALHVAARLERDTRTGWAFTFQHVTEAGGAGDDSPVLADPDPRTCVEFLPHSRAVWNERGRPARWRNLRRAA